MDIHKKKICFLFLHLPNPRMIKRILALEPYYNVEAIACIRETTLTKKNRIPKNVTTNIIKKKANEGKPLKRIGATFQVIIKAFILLSNSKSNKLYVSKLDMLLVAFLYKTFVNKNVEIIYEVSDLHSLVMDNQNNILKRFMAQAIKKLEGFLCKYINILVVTSECFYTSYYRSYITENKVLFIPNTPDPKVFNNLEKKSKENFTVGFIGVIRYAQQIEMLIDAAEDLNIRVLIAGDGIDYQRIKNYSKDKEHVSIYGAYEYEKDIKKLYEKIDCVYSVYDVTLKNVQIALPNRLYEAVYTGTPIIASKDTYLGKIIEDESIGKTIYYNDKETLKEVLKVLEKDEDDFKNIKDRMLILREKWILDIYNKKLVEKLASK